MTIVAPNETDANKMSDVVMVMRELGAPTIKAYWDGEKHIALEGSHRIAAAVELGLDIDIDEVELDDEMAHDVYDCDSNLVADLLEFVGGGDVIEID